MRITLWIIPLTGVVSLISTVLFRHGEGNEAKYNHGNLESIVSGTELLTLISLDIVKLNIPLVISEAKNSIKLSHLIKLAFLYKLKKIERKKSFPL